MSALRKTLTACLVVATLALAACGGSQSHSNASSSSVASDRTVDIYSSLPLQGPLAPQGDAIVNGIELALAQVNGRAGIWTVNYTSLNDATAAGTSTWDGNATSANARRAAEDPKAVYYVGDFSSEASEVSVMILNQAKLPQVSPANTYDGLTASLPGSAPDEPQKYYEGSGMRTFLRIVPNDSVQAAADLIAMKQAGCTKVAVASQAGDNYGAEMAALLQSEKGHYGVTIVSETAIDETASDFRPYAEAIRRQGTDCVFLAGTANPAAVQVTEAINAQLPRAKLFGPDQMCTSAWTNSRLGGVTATIDPLIECTEPSQSLDSYPGGKQFLSAYRAKYGGAPPDPYAIYGYEAMKLGLDTIEGLHKEGNDKLAVLRALFAVRNRASVLGTYSFDRNGDTTLRSYGLYKVGASGNPVFDKTIAAPV